MERKKEVSLTPDREDFLASLKIVCTQDLEDTQLVEATQQTQEFEETPLVEATLKTQEFQETQLVEATQKTQDLEETRLVEATLQTQELEETRLVEATQKTQEFEETQLVEATQDSVNYNDTQKEDPSTETEGSQSDENLSERHKLKGNTDPLKDLSNLPKKSKLIKNDLSDSDRSKSFGDFSEEIPDTQEILDTQEIFSSQDNTLIRENDLTPEIAQINAFPKKPSGLKENTEKVESETISQSSGSSETQPESSLSGSHASSSQISSSDSSTSSQQNHNKQKNAEDCQGNFYATQDMFLSEDPTGKDAADDTPVFPHKKALQKDDSKKSVCISPIPVPGNRAANDGAVFKVPARSLKASEIAQTSRGRRSSREKRRRMISDFPKASPPLDSQDFDLRMSDPECISADDSEDDPHKTPEIMALDIVTPERTFLSTKATPENRVPVAQQEKVLVHESHRVELSPTLLVTTTNRVDCNIVADRDTGDIISLHISNVNSLATDTKLLSELPLSGPIDIRAVPWTGSESREGGSKDRPSDESWKAVLVTAFQEALENSLFSCFQKQARQQARNVAKTVETPRHIPTTPMASGRNPRKRKLSSSSQSVEISPVAATDFQSPKKKTPPTTSPFKRPKLRKLSIERVKTPIKVSSPSSTSTVRSPSLTRKASSPSLITSVSSPNFARKVSPPSYTTTVSSPKLARKVPQPSFTTTVSSPKLARKLSPPSFTTTVPSPKLARKVSQPSFTTTVSSPKLARKVSQPSFTTTVSSPKLARKVSQPSFTSTVRSPSLTTKVTSTTVTTKLYSPKVSTLRMPQDNPPGKSLIRDGGTVFEGATVFARWIDKKYYPGCVLRRASADHWLVKFNDDREKELAESSMCVVNTFEIKQPVLAQSSQVYKKGVIVDVRAFDSMDDEYVVKLDQDGSVLELPLDKLCLNEQMLQFYKQRSSGPDSALRGFPSIDLENVVHGKRNRSTPSPCPGTSSSSARNGSSVKSKPAMSESSSCDEFEEMDSRLKVTGIEPEANNPDPLAGKSLRKGKSRKKSVPEDEQLIIEYGPVPEEGSQIFAGLTFVLTCAANHDHDAKRRNTEEASGYDSHSETECFCESFAKVKKTMSKTRLTEQINAGGGTVVTNVDKLDDWKNFDNVYLIANRPSHTAVYLHCLALGIKGVLFDAVIHCCKKGLNFKEYITGCQTILETGFSIKEKRLVAWNECQGVLKPFTNGTNPLPVHVFSPDKAFVKFWSKILTLGGAQVRKLKSEMEVTFCTVIVAEPPVPDSLRRMARDHTTPIVSVKWIIQSLVHNDALPYNWHSDFQVDSDESD